MEHVGCRPSHLRHLVPGREDDGCSRALRRRVTLIFGGYRGRPRQSTHDSASSGGQAVFSRELGPESVSHRLAADPRTRASDHPPSPRSVTDPHDHAFTDVSGGRGSLRHRDWSRLERGPQKTRELARHRDRNLRGRLVFDRQFPETSAQPLLRLVRDRNDAPRLPLAAAG